MKNNPSLKFLLIFCLSIFLCQKISSSKIKGEKPCDICVENCEYCLNNGNFKTNQKSDPYYNCPNFCSTCYIDKKSFLKCDECFIGFYNINFACFKCDSKCKTCEKSADNCQSCANGSYFVEGNNKCTSLPCPEGYFPQENILDLNKNSNLINNNIISQTDNNGVTALNTFKLIKHDLLCRKCNSKCTKCSSLDKCTECAKGYRKVFYDNISNNMNQINTPNPKILETNNDNETITNNSSSATTAKTPLLPAVPTSMIQLELESLTDIETLLNSSKSLLEKIKILKSKNNNKAKTESFISSFKNMDQTAIKNKLSMTTLNENILSSQSANQILNQNEIKISNLNSNKLNLKDKTASSLNLNFKNALTSANQINNQNKVKTQIKNISNNNIKIKLKSLESQLVTRATAAADNEFDCVRDIKCAEGQYYDYALEICAKCDASCSGCFDSSKNCLKCAANFTKFEKKNNCILKADPPKAHFFNALTNSLDRCSYNCLECIDIGKCQKCDNKFYLDENFSCQKCDEKCEVCDMNPLNCLVCREGFLKLENENKCLNECPSEKYFIQEIKNSNTNMVNSVNNTTINNNTDNLANSGDLNKSGVIGSTRICTKCPKYCASCVSFDKCTSCIQGMTFIRQTYKCELVCLNGFYAYFQNDLNKENDFSCIKCDDSCESCEADRFRCNKCKNNYLQLETFLTSPNFRCFDKCPIGFYLGYQDEVIVDLDLNYIEPGLKSETVNAINSTPIDSINNDVIINYANLNTNKAYSTKPKVLSLIEKKSKTDIECKNSNDNCITKNNNNCNINFSSNNKNLMSMSSKKIIKKNLSSNLNLNTFSNKKSLNTIDKNENNNNHTKFIEKNKHLLQKLNHYDDIKTHKNKNISKPNNIIFLQTQMKNLKNYSVKFYSKNKKAFSGKAISAEAQPKRDLVCRSCTKYCNICEYPGDQCLKCKENYFLLKPEMICISSCKNEKGLFINKTDNSCNRCDRSCKSCEYSAENCIECYENFVKFEKTASNNSSASNKNSNLSLNIISIPKQGYLNENLNIDNSHYLENMEKINFCIPKKQKISGYFFNNKINLFSPCDPSCLECENEPNHCLKCNSGYFNLIDDTTKLMCFESCPKKYYLNEHSNICEFCDESCAECFENPEDCLLCADDYFKIYDTSRCFKYDKYKDLLAKFIVENSEYPMARRLNLNFDNKTLLNRITKKSIEKGNHQSNESNTTNNNVITNSNNKIILSAYNSDSNSASLASVTNDTNSNTNNAILSLESAEGSDFRHINLTDTYVKIFDYPRNSQKKETIIDIKDYFFDPSSNSFKPCAAFCFGCQNSESNCIFCSDGYTRSLVDPTKCVKACKKGFYITIFGCMKCSDECAECKGNDKNCLRCNQNYFVLFDNQSQKDKSIECVEKCPNGHFADYNDKICLLCDKSCVSCDRKAYHCLECNLVDGYLPLEDKQNTCVIDNPTGYYKNLPENKHIKCPENCRYCLSNDKCVDCINSNYSKFFPFVKKTSFFSDKLIYDSNNINNNESNLNSKANIYLEHYKDVLNTTIIDNIKTFFINNSNEHNDLLKTSNNSVIYNSNYLNYMENPVYQNYKFFGNIFATNLNENSECLLKCPSGFFSNSYYRMYRNHYEDLIENSKNGNYINKLIRNSYVNLEEADDQASKLQEFHVFYSNFNSLIFKNEILFNHYFNLQSQILENIINSNNANTKSEFDKSSSLKNSSEIFKENYKRYNNMIINQNICYKCDISCSECASTQNTCSSCNNKAGYVPIKRLEEAEYLIYQEKFPKISIENNCVLESNCPDGFYLYEAENQETVVSISTNPIETQEANKKNNQNTTANTQTDLPITNNLSITENKNNNNHPTSNSNNNTNSLMQSITSTPSQIQLSAREGKNFKISSLLYNLNLNIDFKNTINSKKKCDICSESCMRCSKSKQNCLECNKNYYPLESDRSQCFAVCPKGFFYHKFVAEILCLQCDSSCESCEAASPFCSSCAKGFKHSILDKRVCIEEQCEDRNYFHQSLNQCRKCSDKCLLCAESAGKCLTCNYLNGFFELERRMENTFSAYTLMMKEGIIKCLHKDALNREDPYNYLLKGFYINLEAKKFSFCEARCEECKDAAGICTKCNNKNAFFKFKLSERLNRLASLNSNNLKALSALANLNNEILCKTENELIEYVKNLNSIADGKIEDKIYFYLKKRSAQAEPYSGIVIKANENSNVKGANSHTPESSIYLNVENSLSQDPFELDVCNEGCIGCAEKADFCLVCNVANGFAKVEENLNTPNHIKNNNYVKCTYLKNDNSTTYPITTQAPNSRIFPEGSVINQVPNPRPINALIIPADPNASSLELNYANNNGTKISLGEDCHQSCLTCSTEDPKKCFECNNKYKYYPMKNDPSKCLMITPDGYYFDQQTESYGKCSEGCEKCLKYADFCIGCNSKLDYYPLVDKMNTCTKYCPEGYKFDAARAICDIVDFKLLDKNKFRPIRNMSGGYLKLRVENTLFYLFIILFIFNM